MSDDLVHLHTHTHASAFDGLGKPPEFIERAAELGQPAIAFTEHGSLRGLHESAQAAREAGLKIVPGCEMYLADDASRQGLTVEEKAELKRCFPGTDEYKTAVKAADKARRERDHVTVWATSKTGLRNLLRLTTWSWTKGFYYKPRIDLDVLAAHAEGLAVSSGCPGGVVCAPLRQRDVKTALDRAQRLAEVFGARFLVEIMPHVPDPDCVGLADKLVRIADRFGATLVATQDAHYPREGDSVAQEALLCIHTRSKMDDPARFKFDDRDYWLKSREELERAFASRVPGVSRATVLWALDNTVAFAESCRPCIEPVRKGAYLVAPQLPDGVRDYDSWLIELCRAGIEDRFGGVLPDGYVPRLMHEARYIRELGFAAYFAAVWDLRRWARGQGIFCGPGRGSAAGSLVAYLLRITDLDPIVYDLSFERFLAPGRQDLPDIDLDFEHHRRDEVIDYLRDTYGEDRVAHISTHNALGGRRAVRDLGRIFGAPERDVGPVAALIVPPTDEGSRTDDTLIGVLNNTEIGRAFAERYPDIAAVAGRLEGQIRDIGLHAAGMVVSSVPLVDVVPMETRPRKGGPRVLATAYDMHGVEACGLVKLDVLGVRTLTAIRRALELAGKTVEEVPLDDAAVYAAFSEGRYGAVFQYDTPSARRLCRGYVFRGVSDVAVMTALNRPGPVKSGLAREFIARAADPSRRASVHPVYDEVMVDTYGIPIYQEQVIQLVQRLCGYTPEEADDFRRKVAKKWGLDDEHFKFVAGAIASGMSDKEAEDLFRSLAGFARYAFNRAHSYSYAVIAVWCMWLQVYHPAAFYTAMLATESDPQVQMRLVGEARKVGIPVLPPDVNVPGEGFVLRPVASGHEIVGSIVDLKGIGPSTAGTIAAGAPYADLLAFYRAMAGKRVTVRAFEVLARAGALRGLFSNTRWLAANARATWARLRDGWMPEVDVSATPDHDDEEFARGVAQVWPLYAGIAGRGPFEAAVERAAAACSREVFVPGDPAIQDAGFRLVVGRVGALRLFRGDDGLPRSARVLLTSADCDEVSLRADADVVETAGAISTSSSALVLAGVHTRIAGAPLVAERIWPVEALDAPDDALAWLLSPQRTRPRDPSRALARAEPDETFRVEGLVVRAALRRSARTGSRYLSVGLLGERGYVCFYVFAGRMGDEDVRVLLRPGARVSVRLRKLGGDGDAACLSDSPCHSMAPAGVGDD